MSLIINGRLLFILRFVIAMIVSALPCLLSAQETLPEPPDSTLSVAVSTDSLAFSAPEDSTVLRNSDTVYKKISRDAIEKRVTYEAQDSIVVDLKNRVTYLFGNAVVYYDDIELRADFIQMGFEDQELYATGIADSAGNMRSVAKILILR